MTNQISTPKFGHWDLVIDWTLGFWHWAFFLHSHVSHIAHIVIHHSAHIAGIFLFKRF